MDSALIRLVVMQMEAFEHRNKGQASAAALTTEQLIAKATNTPLNTPVIPSLAAHNNHHSHHDEDGDDGEDDGDDYVEPVDTSKPRNKVGHSAAVTKFTKTLGTRVLISNSALLSHSNNNSMNVT